MTSKCENQISITISSVKIFNNSRLSQYVVLITTETVCAYVNRSCENENTFRCGYLGRCML